MEQFISLLANPWLAGLAIIIGFVLLIYGADWLVDGASSVAKQLGVSDLVIGLTVVAFGTSMPELIVSLLAATQHNTELAITNVLGSNAINTCIILGVTAIIFPISSKQSARNFDIPWSLLAGVIVLLFATYTKPDTLVWNNIGEFSFQSGFISGIGGIVMLLCFVLFMWHSFKFSKEETETTATTTTHSPYMAALLIVAGLIALVIGGEAIVRSATSIASMMGVSDAIIGLTIVALGTSLPELATSCVAAAKHNCDLALGNVIGSNIFNIFFILGLSAVIHPLPIYSGLWLDAVIVSISALLVLIFVNTNPQHQIKRWHGVLLIVIYAMYLTYRLISL